MASTDVNFMLTSVQANQLLFLNRPKGKKNKTKNVAKGEALYLTIATLISQKIKIGVIIWLITIVSKSLKTVRFS